MSNVVRFNRDQIIAARGFKTRDLPAPELGEGVVLNVRGMTAGEQGQIAEAQNSGNEIEGGMRARTLLVKFCVIDQHGARIFNDNDDDVINSLDAGLVTKIAVLAGELSGLGKERIDELTGKEPSGPTGGDSASG